MAYVRFGGTQINVKLNIRKTRNSTGKITGLVVFHAEYVKNKELSEEQKMPGSDVDRLNLHAEYPRNKELS